jgi:hypothetical protein
MPRDLSSAEVIDAVRAAGAAAAAHATRSVVGAENSSGPVTWPFVS